MKKFVAMMMLVILTLSLGVAQAKGLDDVRAWSVEQKPNGKIGFFVTYATPKGAYFKAEVSRDTFEEAVIILHAREIEEQRRQKKLLEKREREEKMKDLISKVTFWNKDKD